MTVRNAKHEYRGLIIAAALIVPVFATGCATPLTHMEWGTQRTASNQNIHTTPTHYTYASEKTRCACDDDNAVPVPVARPRRSWWEPAVSHPVQQPAYTTPTTAANANARFLWPVKGRVLSEFGSTNSGERNDGINIAAQYGDPIRAAADGTVSYSGNELKSYGNLVLLKHDNGYVTAYAHAEHFIVAKGDHVARGQVIGYVGSSGDVSSPQLHFELRRGARGETPVDPRPLMGSLQVATR